MHRQSSASQQKTAKSLRSASHSAVGSLSVVLDNIARKLASSYPHLTVPLKSLLLELRSCLLLLQLVLHVFELALQLGCSGHDDQRLSMSKSSKTASEEASKQGTHAPHLALQFGSLAAPSTPPSPGAHSSKEAPAHPRSLPGPLKGP